jgi:hypothetical protein
MRRASSARSALNGHPATGSHFETNLPTNPVPRKPEPAVGSKLCPSPRAEPGRSLGETRFSGFVEPTARGTLRAVGLDHERPFRYFNINSRRRCRAFPFPHVYMIIESVFALAARRANVCKRRHPGWGRAGEAKTNWTKPRGVIQSMGIEWPGQRFRRRGEWPRRTSGAVNVGQI